MLTNDKSVRINIETAIKKSNEFSLAKLSKGLTLGQTQLFSFTLLNTESDTREVKFRRSEYMRCFGLPMYKTEYALRDVDAISSLRFSTVDLEADKFSFHNIFSTFSYDNGEFTAVWTPEILPHIINLQEKYILTDLSLTAKFKSSYSWILYDVVKAYYGFHYKEYTHKGLVNLFNLEEKPSYIKNFALIRRSILDIAVKEINEHTEYTVSYTEIKDGRKTVGVRLEWSKGTFEIAVTEAQQNEIRQIIDYVVGGDGMEKYVTGVHSDRIQESASIVGEFYKYSNHLNEFLTGLTYESAEDAITYFKNRLGRLEENLKCKSLGTSLGQTPPKIFYNWLVERE